MKIKEMCKKVKFNDVFEALKEMYQVSDLDKLNYLRTFRKIRNAKDRQLNIAVRVEKNSDWADIYDVYGISKDSKNKLILNLSHFDEWGNFYEMGYNFSDNKFIAHILFESTYISFNEKDIDNECLNQIKKRGL